MTATMAHISSTSFQGWRTPKPLAAALVAEFDCKLDAAADKDNAVCPVFYDGTEGSDGLLQPWNVPGAGVWVNPPYEDCGSWIVKACEEVLLHENCQRAVLLVPAAVGVAWFSRACRLAEVSLFEERIRFDLPPREELPEQYRDKLYRQRPNGTWVPKTSPGGGNALIVVEIGRHVGVNFLRNAKTGAVAQDFVSGYRVE